MKAIATISTMIMAAGLAAGQAASSPAYKPAAPASQSQTAATKTTKTATTTAAKPAMKPATTAKPGAASVSTAKAKPAPSRGDDSARGRRDPFVSPVVERVSGDKGTACSTGKRCLIIDQLAVEGVVCSRLDMLTPVKFKEPRKCQQWIAVLANPAQKVYYVRENDALYDGYVARITGDSVVFRQNVIDALGKSVQKEVVKRIAPST
jgi:hypothetical protein